MSKSYIVEGYWDCSSCGKKGIRGSVRECPGCGKPRSEDVQFYLKEYGKEHAVSEDISKEADWLCEYCMSYNPAHESKCISCGADKNSKNYSQFHDTNSTTTIKDDDNNGIADTGELSDKERDKLYWEAKRQKNNVPRPTNTVDETNSDKRKQIYQKVGMFLAIAVVLMGIIYYFVPKEVDVDVTDVAWQRSIQIQQWQTVDESNWDAPPKARVYRQQEEIHHYDKIVDHYEDYYEDVSETVLDHYETIQKQRDLGNGHFEISEEQKPVYKTVMHKEKRQKPVYKEVPVYRIKYYYKLERWKNNRTVDTSGNDKNPYYGEYSLAKGEGQYNVGEEKVSGSSEKYIITGIIKGEKKTLVVDDYEWWKDIEVGDKIKGKMTYDGHLIKDNK